MPLEGRVDELSLADLIQIAAHNRRTMCIRLRDKPGRTLAGALYLAEGELVHAVLGDLIGIEAVYAALCDPKLSYTVEMHVLSPARSVTGSWQHILLEAARRQDEGSLPRPRPIVAEPAPQTRRRISRPAFFLVGMIAIAGSGFGGWMIARAVRSRTDPVASAGVTPTATTAAPAAQGAPAATPIDATTLTGPDDAQPVLVDGAPPAPPAVDLALAPTIVCRLHIAADGTVAQAAIWRARLDLTAFEDAALDAVARWRFSPARKDGRPVAVWINWPVTFRAPRAIAERVRIKGSDTIGGELGPALAAAYMRDHASTRIEVEALGSSTAFVGLFDGSADLGASSRPIHEGELTRARELGLTLEERVIGYDGIAIVVHETNPIQELTIDQASRIFSGRITNWKDLGGPDRAIVVVSRPGYSGTHDFFLEKVVRRGDKKGPETFRAGTIYIERSQDIAKTVAGDPRAIGYFGVAWLAPGVRALRVSPGAGSAAVAPDADAVREGRYPIYRPLLFYTRGAPRGATASFVRFVLSAAGQAIVAEHGFVPAGVSSDPIVDTTTTEEAPAPSIALRIEFPRGGWNVPGPRWSEIVALGRRAAGDRRRLLVVGHADTEGGSTSNLEISRRRAETVAAALRRSGVDPSQITIEASGSDRPLATNTTGDGRSKNRRVDVYVLPR